MSQYARKNLKIYISRGVKGRQWGGSGAAKGVNGGVSEVAKGVKGGVSEASRVRQCNFVNLIA
jgi:hypothetical protein